MYIELHCHSAFSFLDGASLPEQLALTASQLGYPALALPDHHGLYGSMAFAQESQKLGLQAITGAELTLLDGAHVTLLAETPEAYAILCRLLTEAHLGRADRRDPRLDFASLEARHAGLIVLSGCRNGLLPGVLRRDGPAAARRLAERCRAVFGKENCYVELQRNYVRGDLALTRALNDVADSVGLDVVASGNVHYHKRERHRLHDVLVAIRHRTTLDGSHNVRHANSEFFLRPPQEVEELFRNCPDAVANTIVLAERCRAFDLTRDLGYTFPDFRGADLTPAPRALAELCRAKLEELYPTGSPHRDDALRRLEQELTLIEHHRLSGFFLVYHDLFDLAREVAADVRRGSRRAHANLLPGRGRGSSVSSIVCYLLGLSHIDPIANGLFLGRFLNDTLASVPDIDLDFPREIREELIRRVYKRYGDEHVGLVCSFPTYRLRSTVREIGKALDLPPGEIEQVARLADRRSGGRAGATAGLRGPDGRPALERAVRAGGGGRRTAPPHLPARGRDGHLEPAPGRDRAARARRDGRPGGVPVGQGFVRRRALHQDRLPGARHAVAGGGVRRAGRRTSGHPARSLAHRLHRRRGLRPYLPGRHGGAVPDREPGADPDAAAHPTPQPRGPGGRGRDRPPGPDRGRRGESVRAAPRRPAPRPRGGPDLQAAPRPSAARGGARGNARRDPLSGPGAAGVPGARGIHGGPGGGVTARHEPAPQPRNDGRVLGGVPGRCRGARRSRDDRRAGIHAGDRVLGIRVPQIARRRVRAARLPVGVAPALSPGRVLLRALQQPADGVLFARRAGTGREPQ